MNIFVRELKSNLRSLLVWAGIMVLFILIAMSKFSAYEGNPDMLAILDSMPPAVMEAFQFSAFNLTTVTGFFGVMFTWFALIVSIAAAMWGSDIISKEERDKTVEFSLTLPVTRSRMITAKALAAFINCIALLLVTWGASVVGVAQYSPDSAFYEFLTLCMVAIFFMQIIFLAVGILLGCAMKQYKRAGSAAVSILLATYFISIITSMNDDLSFLEPFSPFTYFNPATLLHESKIEVTFVILSVAIAAAAIAAAYFSYSKRDLYI